MIPATYEVELLFQHTMQGIVTVGSFLIELPYIYGNEFGQVEPILLFDILIYKNLSRCEC